MEAAVKSVQPGIRAVRKATEPQLAAFRESLGQAQLASSISRKWLTSRDFVSKLNDEVAEQLAELKQVTAKTAPSINTEWGEVFDRATATRPWLDALTHVRSQAIRNSKLISPVGNKPDSSSVDLLAARALRALVPEDASEAEAVKKIAPFFVAASGGELDEAIAQAAFDIANDREKLSTFLGTSDPFAADEVASEAIGVVESEARSVTGWRPLREYKRATRHQTAQVLGGSMSQRFFHGISNRTLALIALSLSCAIGSIAIAEHVAPTVTTVGASVTKAEQQAGVTTIRVVIYVTKGPQRVWVALVEWNKTLSLLSQNILASTISGLILASAGMAGKVAVKQIKKVSRNALRCRKK